MFWNKRYSGTCLLRQAGCPPKCSKPGQKNCPAYTPDFMKIAQAYGLVGIKITDKKDVIPALKKALSINNKPVLMEFIVEQEENVLPMVPAGAALDEIITTLA
jgi:acetolactate synthase I/II/III large subunit